jgi:hypothetical protein
LRRVSLIFIHVFVDDSCLGRLSHVSARSCVEYAAGRDLWASARGRRRRAADTATCGAKFAKTTHNGWIDATKQNG